MVVERGFKQVIHVGITRTDLKAIELIMRYFGHNKSSAVRYAIREMAREILIKESVGGQLNLKDII